MEETPQSDAGDEAAQDVRWVSRAAQTSERVRRYAETADPAEALERACRWSQQKTPERRRKAAVILSALTGRGVYECALRLIEDPANATRLAAIAALGNVADPRAVAQLERR